MKAKDYIKEHGWDDILSGKINAGGTSRHGVKIPFDHTQWVALKSVMDEYVDELQYDKMPDEWWVDDRPGIDGPEP